MKLVAFVLKKPYTVAASLMLICILGAGAALRMPIDIFPEIDIPVVSVVWSYNGMSAEDIQNRILTLHERQLASLVDDISRIEATSYYGVGVIKVFLHQGADVTRAVSQLASSALVVLKYMPPNITPPLVLRYGATDVPIIQLSLSSDSLPDTKLNDLGQNTIRPALAVVHGAEVPYPYGGKPRVIMVDLDQQALQSRGLTPSDVARAIQQQNVILPSGDVKIGSKDYMLAMNNSPDAIASINQFPVGEVDGRTIFMRDVAHVHDGYQVQTNSVAVDGKPGALMMVRKTGGVSTLDVIEGVKNALPYIRKLLPEGVEVKAIFDQSVFVKAALSSVLMGGLLAAGLTALMILLFLGNWRLTLIILAAIPLSIITAVLVLYISGQTLNTMTLGGFALAVGILVDNGTVVIENIERHLQSGEPLTVAIVDGCGEVGIPTMLSTLSICIVFVPVFLLQGTAKYLFSPMSLSVIVSLLASLALSFTMIPVLFEFLMRSSVEAHASEPDAGASRRRGFNIFSAIHHGFESGFSRFREAYRDSVAFSVKRAGVTSAFFILLIAFSLPLFPQLGRDFFPRVDAGQMRLHVRAPPATRIEETQRYFAEVESVVRKIVGEDQIDIILDNIGLPYSGINIALSDSATIGPMDGEILISLKEKHTPTADHVANLRRELPKRFPELQFFFQPADIVDQVLNFGQPAPIDVRVSGPNSDESYAVAAKIARSLANIPGVVDSHVSQVPDAPALAIDVDRTLARQLGISEDEVIKNVLVSTNSSAQTLPNFWVDPKNNVSYPLVVQMPTYHIKSAQDLWTIPVTAKTGSDQHEMLMNIATFGRVKAPIVSSQYNITPVFDVNADVEGRDLASVGADIDKILAANRSDSAVKITLSGQVETMIESYGGLFSGMALAVVLVYLLLVINFQSWVDPLIVLMALPFALAGVMWMLFLTGTHLSVPALMGGLMCLGLATANSILVVSFANQRVAAGDDKATAAVLAGYTRLRPVLMTAGAMILGMIPMALGVGEGGEQNAPLARAVIGGLLFATFATLIFVPVMYRLLRREPRLELFPASHDHAS
ncbi:efflux RND transporter permease subunit [Methylocella tundrae]|uniref:RND transporter n=1 Tax=Methylocella tundrae TaxID=227605 RepID=A0A4U8Z7G3_METTU|nr:efflux RND transporter permease subunit [Methylocella tundrae]WPP03046.1 efflux RND transporter permease subunit [Methylocella tundrae]VFU16265.1 RND transporter [Methylocella tundrae]